VDILLKSFQTNMSGCDWNAWSDLRIVSRLSAIPARGD